MDKIFFIGDCHIGKNFMYRMNDQNISDRAWELFNQFKAICDEAIQSQVILLVIAGDFYDRFVINTTIQDKVHQLIEQLYKKDIGIFLIGGNHDSSSDLNKSVGLDLLKYFANVIVFRDLIAINFANFSDSKLDNTILRFTNIDLRVSRFFIQKIFPRLAYLKVGFSLLPFLSPKFYIECYMKTIFQGEKDQLDLVEYTNIEQFINDKIMIPFQEFLKNCKYKFCVGHYMLKGAKIHAYAEINPKEIQFSKEMVSPEFYTFVAFGHIHVHQLMFNQSNVVHIGSVDRIDFSDIDQKKGYYEYDFPNQKIQFIDRTSYLQKMIRIDIKISQKELKPNQFIESKILSTLKNEKNLLCWVRLYLTMGVNNLLNRSDLDKFLLSLTYASKIEYKIIEDEGLKHVTVETEESNQNINFSELVTQFISERFSDHQYKTELLQKANEVFNQYYHEKKEEK